MILVLRMKILVSGSGDLIKDMITGTSQADCAKFMVASPQD